MVENDYIVETSTQRLAGAFFPLAAGLPFVFLGGALAGALAGALPFAGAFEPEPDFFFGRASESSES